MFFVFSPPLIGLIGLIGLIAPIGLIALGVLRERLTGFPGTTERSEAAKGTPLRG